VITVADEELVSPAKNASDSLERVAEELASGIADAMGLKAVLTWGWHAIGLLAYARLQPNRDDFDAWLQAYLGDGEPTLVVERDAWWEERERLSFLEMIDLLSEEDLPILKPEFYQGWQDRTSRCRGLRRQAARLIGSAIGEAQRNDLLLLLSAYHRLIRLPVGVSLSVSPVRSALPALLDLAEALVEPGEAGVAEIEEAIGRCREGLK
jgi:hypothetical protein